ncbi:MAG: hypothetical protein AABY61_13285 [Nitrospirota bacterium]
MPQVHFVRSREEAGSTAFRKIWSAADDATSILAAHLVSEAMLFRFIQTKTANPEALDLAQWTYSEILVLVQSLRKKSSKEEWLWKTLRSLNSVRNRLAHDIETQHLPERIEKMYKTADRHIDIHAPGADPKDRENNKLKYFLLILCGVVNQLQNLDAEI